MLKRIIIFTLIILLLLPSCSWSKEKRIIENIEKTYKKYEGYICLAEINMKINEVESKYLIEEEYISAAEYKLEILEPKESRGITIQYTDDKIFIEHPSIEQSISMAAIKSLNDQLTIGDFFENISNATLKGTEKIDSIEYLIFNYDLPNKNKYKDSAKVWIKKKGFTPYKLNILDDNDKLIIEIIYDDFKFLEKDKNK